jgi:hypothetical protein
LCHKGGQQLRRHWNHARLIVPGGPWIEADDALLQIHLIPLERENFAATASRVVAERQDGAVFSGKRLPQAQKLFMFDETLADVIYLTG